MSAVDLGPFLAAAERVLAEALGGTMRLETGDTLRDRYRNRVLRCTVVEAPDGVPPSVIIKASVGDDEHPFDPGDDQHESPAWRFFNEWAGTKFLNARALDPPLCARLLGGDRVTGLIVLEDLGDGASLADALQGDDPAAATAALESYAASMGRLHAQTVGGEAGWRRVRLSVGGSETAHDGEGARWLDESIPRFVKGCDALDVPVAPGFEDEAATVAEAMSAPGAFLAFAPGDTCPDNHRLVPNGFLRFFDFEFAGFRHALLDAAYLHVPFPTCWCVNRLPGGLPERLEAAYRAELMAGCPDAADDGVFYPAMSQAAAHWVIATLSWSLEPSLEKDQTWGISTVRQRAVERLDNLARVTSRFGHLPAITETARTLAAKLRALWPPEETEMPLYPPFRFPSPRKDS